VTEPVVPAASALRWLWLSAVLIAVDQASKALIVARLELFERREWLPILEVTRLHNRGAAFSFLNDATGWQKYLFVGLALLVSVGIVVWLSRLALARSGMLASGLSLILGGAIGNVIDRVTRGYVVDFIHFHWYAQWDFPAFNAADTGITVGAGLLILDSLLEARRNRTASGARSAKEPGET
jgi:signal peptidase II